MSVTSSLAFALAVLLFAATPGPAVLACVSQALGSGFRSALALAAGIVTGDAIYLLVAIYGLALVSQVPEGLFVLVRLAGGAYLAWMGWRTWSSGATASAARPASRREGFQAGLLVTLGNPKVVAFYLGFLPAFLDLASLSTGDVLQVTALTVTVLMAVNCAWAWTAARARQWAIGATAVRRMNRSAGGLLMAIGVWVMADR